MQGFATGGDQTERRRHSPPYPVEEDGLSPPAGFDAMEPDEEHFREATGNEGASFERTCRRAAMVLWPRAQFFCGPLPGWSGGDTALPRRYGWAMDGGGRRTGWCRSTRGPGSCRTHDFRLAGGALVPRHAPWAGHPVGSCCFAIISDAAGLAGTDGRRFA